MKDVNLPPGIHLILVDCNVFDHSLSSTSSYLCFFLFLLLCLVASSLRLVLKKKKINLFLLP